MIFQAPHLELIVTDTWLETDDIRCVQLADACGKDLPAFSAGSHLDVFLPDGLGVRQYSLTGDPAHKHQYLIAIKKDNKGRGGSIWLHDRIDTGTRLRVSPPRNNFPLVDNGEFHLLLGGGIGVTPLLPMALTLLRGRGDFVFHVCASSYELTPFRSLLESAEMAPHVELHHRRAGRNALDVASLFEHVMRTHGSQFTIHCCGPVSMMQDVHNVAAKLGFSASQLQVESFTPTKSLPSLRDGSEMPESDGGFEVELARSGVVYRVDPGVSILEVLLEHGNDLPRSGEQGLCGVCAVKVIAGRPDHRDTVLSAADRETSMTICCSRSLTPRLVLDL